MSSPSPDAAGRRACIVIPVHNRRDVTLQCLRTLREQQVLDWAAPIVVDDGSTDGTAASVRAEFPGAIILPGNGQLWWTGAIALGMMEAMRRDAACVFWLNDDCIPAPDALARLRDAAFRENGIVAGVCRIPGTSLAVYGGYRRKGFEFVLVDPDCEPFASCDALSGHLVCIPRSVIDRIGLPDARHLPHAWGDFDYCLRARAAGFALFADAGAAGWSAPNSLDNISSWLLGDIPLGAMWLGLGRKGSYSYLPAHACFLTRHFGWRGALHCVWQVVKRLPVTVARLVLPARLRRRWWGAGSSVWQNEQRVRAALRISAR